MVTFETAEDASLEAFLAVSAASPHQERLRLATQLVRRGTQRLLSSGAGEIRGDCDHDNVGMVKAFRRAGYEQFARRRTYRRAVAKS